MLLVLLVRSIVIVVVVGVVIPLLVVLFFSFRLLRTGACHTHRCWWCVMRRKCVWGERGGWLKALPATYPPMPYHAAGVALPFDAVTYHCS